MQKISIPWIVGLLVGLFVLSACSTVDYVTDAPERVSAANWNQMQVVPVEMTEYAYSPPELRFEVNVPYKLQIRNTGRMKHYFTSEDFFKAIATRKMQSNTDGEIKAPYFTAIEVFPDRSLDLYFIPVKRGVYRVRCTIEGHELHGMQGTIIIE